MVFPSDVLIVFIFYPGFFLLELIEKNDFLGMGSILMILFFSKANRVVFVFLRRAERPFCTAAGLPDARDQGKGFDVSVSAFKGCLASPGRATSSSNFDRHKRSYVLHRARNHS